MLAAMSHRGPDDRGLWANGPVALAHLRLTILDPSDHGHQPMASPDHTGALVYNGEVYNYRELRKELEEAGVRFSGTGDTEVVFHALRSWGAPEAVRRFNGMFAFAWWDDTEGTLWLGRDRLGIKPLYVTTRGAAFLFASEIKGLLAHPDVPTRPDWRGLPAALVMGRLSDERTLFEGIRGVRAGELLRVSGAGIRSDRYFDAVRDVDPERIVAAAQEDPEAAVDRLEAALRKSVALHLASDVPVAVMCSGGVDSSLVTAYAREALPDVTAYVADVGGEVGEGDQARRVADHLGVPLHRIDLDREAHLRLLPWTTWYLEAPNCHPSDPALLTVTRRCRGDGIKVLLTGEGSDELFGGYPWQARTWASWRKKETLRYRLRSGRARQRRDRERAEFGPLESDFLRHLPPVRWRLFGILGPDAQLRSRRIASRLSPVQPGSDRAFLAHCIEDLYRHLSSILQRHDRMGMAASMEMRVPFLENALIDFALHAPRRWKLERGRGKWIVKRAAERHLPHDVVHAPKKGFPVPDGFMPGLPGLLRGGALEEALDWSAEATEDLVALAHVDPGAHRLANAEIWARVFLRREDPDELGERLVHGLA